MIWMIIIGLAFLALLLFPVLFGIYWYYRSKDSVLFVRADYKKDPRYFSKSFKQKLAKAWDVKKGDQIQLSKREKFWFANELTKSRYQEGINSIVLADEKLHIPESSKILSEVCGRDDIVIGACSNIRSICSDKNIDMEDGGTIFRWIDAEEKLHIGNHCDLGVSATSLKEIQIGMDTTFVRLFAPVIHLGVDAHDKKSTHTLPTNIYDYPISEEYIYNSGYIGETYINEDGIVNDSIISTHKLTIKENLVITGNIASHSGIQIARGSVVCGNIFAEKNIYLGDNCIVLGNIFTQGNVYCENNVTIGHPGEIRSVVARGKVTFGENCIVYGSINSEVKGGVCLIRKAKKAEPENIGDYIGNFIEHFTNAFPNYTKVTIRLIGCICAAIIVVTCSYISNMTYDDVIHPTQNESDDIQMDFADVKTQVNIRDNDWSDDQIQQLSEGIDNLAENLKKAKSDITVYAGIMPYYKGKEQIENKVFQSINPEIVQVPVNTLLYDKVNVQEYMNQYQDKQKIKPLYYEDEDVWTSNGAYVFANEFLDKAGLDRVDVADFNEYVKVPNTHRHYYYLYQNYNPLVEVHYGGMVEKAIPMISFIRRGTSKFIGTHKSYTVIDGLANNNRVLAVIDDEGGNVVVPWLITQYQKIIYVDIQYYEREIYNLKTIITAYDVTDALIVIDGNVNRDTTMKSIPRLIRRLNTMMEGVEE